MLDSLSTSTTQSTKTTHVIMTYEANASNHNTNST